MIGEKIRALRNRRGDNLRQLGAKVGYTHAYLGKVERGEIRAKTELIQQIARVYDVPEQYFFDEAPDDLKKIGAEWVRFAENMEDRGLKPDEITELIDMAAKINNKSK